MNDGNDALRAIAEIPGVYIHPHALVETRDIGAGTRVWAFAHLLAGSRVGRDCNICDHTFIEQGVTLGDRVTVKCGIYIWEGVRCADDVFLGPNVVFTNDLRPRSRRRPERFEPTTVDRGASIGANATIIAGIRIGRYAMVGAGSVVTRDVPDHVLAYGNPARPHGYVCSCGENLRMEGEVGSCPHGCKTYRVVNGVCRPNQDSGDNT